jgi:hypothetical protein
MKRLFYLCCLAIFISACAPKIGSRIAAPQTPLSDTDYVLVLQQEDTFSNDGIEVGTIKSGDNGFSTNCTYYEVIGKLKALARKNGANVIKIVAHKSPDKWSTCERITARVYRVPDIRRHEQEIEWSPYRRLTWDDFKGRPREALNPGVAAQTYCGFGFQTNRVTMFKQAKVFSINTFSCYLSWVRPDQKGRADLLAHEQGHFDLCEVYARQLRKVLLERKLTVYNLTTDANLEFRHIYNQYLNKQELYEKGTDYGRNRQKQLEWEQRIREYLDELHDYAQ